MSDFKPYVPEDTYKVVLTKDETLLIQKLRETKWGSITVHLAGGRIIRLETVSSELAKDKKDEKITIALEVITN